MQQPSRSAAWRYRRWLLVPVIPVLALIGIPVLLYTASLLPGPAGLGIFAVQASTLYHAANRARSGWAVALAFAWPSVLVYWIYFGLGLGRSALPSTRPD